MICVGSKAMLAVSIDLFTNISRNIRQTDMLIAVGSGSDAAEPELGVTTAVQYFLAVPLI